MKKIVLGIMLLAVFLVAGCNAAPTVAVPTQAEPTKAEPAKATGNKYGLAPGAKIGMSMTDKSEQRWVMDGEKMKVELEKKGYTLDLQYANMEPQTQIAQIENMILTGCKAIVVVPVDSGSLGAVLKKAKEANVLVINYDLMALKTPDIDYYIGFDNKQVGKIQANYIVEKLGLKNGAGPFNMEIFAGSLDEVNAFWYHEEAMKILQPYIDSGKLVVKSGQIDIKTVTIPGWAAEKTSARMENLVTTYYSDGTKLDVVLAPADSIAVPIGNTLKAIGYGTKDKPMPIITGNNGNPSVIQSIKAGQVSMSIFKDTRNLAKRTAEVIDSIANGIELVPDDTTTFDNGVIKIPAFLYGMEVIDINNWKQLAFDSGYYTAEQLGIVAEPAKATGNKYGLAPGAKIGMSMTDKSEQRWVMDGEKMKVELEKKGYTLDLQYANMEPQTQIAQIENMILTGCKAIVVVPVDSGSLGAVLKKAKEANVLVINYDLMALKTPDIDYYIGFDNKQVGKIQANYIVEKLGLKNGAGPFNMEIFAGSLDEVNAFWYHEEAMKILQPYIDSGKLVVKSGQIDIKTVTIPGWAAEKTSARMENLVTTYYSDGTKLDVVLAPADSIAVPIGNTLKAIGYGTKDKPMPIITGNNGNPSVIQSIKAGQVSMSIFKDTRNLAKRTAEVIDSIANGIELVPDDTTTFDNGVIKIPAFLYGMEVIDINNWKQLAFDSGYYTAEQLGIK